jgi:hypothetical protein
MIIKVRVRKEKNHEGRRELEIASVLTQDTLNGRDTHAVFEPGSVDDNSCLCENFFHPEEGILSPEMISLLEGMETIDLPNLTALGANAFWGCEALKKIKLPDRLVDIGSACFEDCHNLTEVMLPNGIKTIPEACFCDCDSLEEITIPASVRTIGYVNFDWGMLVGTGAFANCQNLRQVHILKGTQFIGNNSFTGCESLQSINLPESLKYLCPGAFEGCSQLASVDLPRKLEKIGHMCFSGCESMEEVSIPSSVKSIDGFAFSRCKSLREVSLPNCTAFFGEKIFNDCENLEKVTMPRSLESLTDYLFTGRSSSIEYVFTGSEFPLKEYLLCKNDDVLLETKPGLPGDFVLPEQIQIISQGAFNKTVNENQSVNLLHTVKFRNDAFKGVHTVRVLDTSYYPENFGDLVRCGSHYLEFIDNKRNTLGRFDLTILIKEYSCVQLRNQHTIPSPKEYDDLLFNLSPSYISNLRVRKLWIVMDRLKFPLGLSDDARARCVKYLKANKKDALDMLVKRGQTEYFFALADYLITQGNFDQLMELAHINNLQEWTAFLLDYKRQRFKDHKTGGKHLELGKPKPEDPDSFRQVQRNWYLTDLSSEELTLSARRKVTDLSGVVTLPTYAGKKAITKIGGKCNIHENEIVIPSGYKCISYGAFTINRGGTKITMADSVIEMGPKAFWGSDQLNQVRLSDRLKRIDDETFRGCKQLTEINMPADLEYIGRWAFRGCESLEKLELSDKVLEIGEGAFSNCPKLVIHTPEGSFAHQYARINSIRCSDQHFDEMYAPVSEVITIQNEDKNTLMTFEEYVKINRHTMINAGIKERWEKRIIATGIMNLGRVGAEKYLASYGQGIHAAKVVLFALKAEQEGYLDLALGFWLKAYEIENGVTADAKDYIAP